MLCIHPLHRFWLVWVTSPGYVLAVSHRSVWHQQLARGQKATVLSINQGISKVGCAISDWYTYVQPQAVYTF